MTAEPLPLTGERTVPGIPEENYWFRRHEAAYLALAPHCAGATVLEAGCGEGYGADLLAGVADRVVALDYDQLTAAHVHRAYPRVGVVRGNLATLPLADESVDVVANLQVIEHLWDQHGFLVECRRVLRPGGRLLVTTPNRITFSPGRDTPLNPFHTRELAPSELDSLLRGAGFRVEGLQGLRHGPDIDAAIIDRQVEVVLGGNGWPDELLTEVKAVTADDFVITEDDVDSSLDLVAVAVKP
ncbi:bifunctional 2-polyprenyl-6-hydroxyphenol methylase/3-demethylubiquinol 3-O-methyltransferase UbiG [Kutzneria sp. 744]|uniref:class I SAM-dependent methyltransferase n=1 Tax=Kutzneria sp. (strain 744) TaxID=345341 RepID=UPI0003EEC689|nr:class I SAM-dependent methyltransferase [Kutzneria sp. 744]EWM16232.1 3-demethylubiquinone-9 3-methyltransferase [Kutzneria sp. 744]